MVSAFPFRFFVHGSPRDAVRWSVRHATNRTCLFAPVMEHQSGRAGTYLSTLQSLADALSDPVALAQTPRLAHHRICVKLSALGVFSETRFGVGGGSRVGLKGGLDCNGLKSGGVGGGWGGSGSLGWNGKGGGGLCGLHSVSQGWGMSEDRCVEELDRLMRNFPFNTLSFDAEQGRTREAYSAVVNALVERHGSRVEKVYQSYLKASPQELAADLDLLRRPMRVRVVRGAYMWEERPQDLVPNKAACDAQLDTLLHLALAHPSVPAVVLATQNPATVWRWGFSYQDPSKFEVSTLLGFASPGTGNMRNPHPRPHPHSILPPSHMYPYPTSLYVPFGSLTHAVPFLARRARSVLGL